MKKLAIFVCTIALAGCLASCTSEEKIENTGNFYDFGSYAFFWSSTPNGSRSAYLLLVCSLVCSSDASVGYSNVNLAFSVRCLKDSN